MILEGFEAKVAFEGFHSIDRFQVLDKRHTDRVILRYEGGSDLIIVLHKSLDQDGFV